ncbi:MAG: hypothetical protein PWP65_1707 [Clostridia bacterium]|nr:hypothetical protein [Clostridia bacterium]
MLDGFRKGHSAPGPYPPVRVKGKNLDYARILMDDYAGFVSELTAITQYLHHHLTIANDEVSRLLENISLVEMRHLEMLGRTIVLLGGDPRYENSGRSAWNGNYVMYDTGNMCRQLEDDIAAERAAIANYRNHINMIDDPYIQAMLERIIQDEELHLKLLTEAKNKYCNR